MLIDFKCKGTTIFLNIQNFLSIKFIFTNNLEFACIYQNKLYIIVYIAAEA